MINVGNVQRFGFCPVKRAGEEASKILRASAANDCEEPVV